MRDIEYRGLTRDNEWVYGFFCGCDMCKKAIPEYDKFPLDGLINHKENLYGNIPVKNVCQFTGLRDAYDNKIYEGDIYYNDIDDENGIIVWSDSDAMFVLIVGNIEYNFGEANSKYGYVVGDIYKNADLYKFDKFNFK